jgi:rod shape-determining protein MreD
MSRIGMSGPRVPGIRPEPTLGSRIDAAGRAAFPAATTALALLVISAPIGLPAAAELRLAVAFTCVFFWTVFRPASLPPLVVFALGLLCDLLGQAPLGLDVLVLLAVQAVALKLRRVLEKQGFVRVWMAFASCAATAAAATWLGTMALTMSLLPLTPAMATALLAAGLYPLLAFPLARAHRTLAEPLHA